MKDEYSCGHQAASKMNIHVLIQGACMSFYEKDLFHLLVLGRKELFLCPSRFCDWGCANRTEKRQINRRRRFISYASESLTEMKQKPQRGSQAQRLVYHFSKEWIICGGVTRWKENAFQLVGVVNCGKLNIWGKLMEVKGYFSKGCLCTCQSVLVPVIELPLLPGTGRVDDDAFTKGSLCPALRQMEEGKEPLLHLLLLSCLELKIIIMSN